MAPIANEYARQFVAFRRRADRPDGAAGPAPLRSAGSARSRTASTSSASLRRARGSCAARAGSTEIRTLRAERDELLDEARELSTQGTLTSGNVEIAQRASTPGAPSSPRPAPTIALGLGLGLLLGIGLALLFELLDRRLRDPKRDRGASSNRPTLGAIPLSPALARNSRTKPNVRGKSRALGAGEMEAFHMLRANLRYFETDRADQLGRGHLRRAQARARAPWRGTWRRPTPTPATASC